MKITMVEMPAKRYVCTFCGCKLTKRTGIAHCTTDGIVLTVCSKHTEAGDFCVAKLQLIARMIQSEQLNKN